MKSWIIKYEIYSYTRFDNSFNYGDFNFFEVDNKSYAASKVESKSLEQAKEICNNKLRKVISCMEFTLNEKFDFEFCEAKQQYKEGIDLFVPAASKSWDITIISKVNFPNEKYTELESYLKLLEISDDNSKIAYDSYINGIEVFQWNNEAYLNFFKSIEVIANEYLEKGKEEKYKETQNKCDALLKNLKKRLNKEEINTEKIKNLCSEVHKLGYIELKSKIKLALEDLDLQIYIEQIDKLVNDRNQIAAHGSSKESITDEQVILCKEIAREMIEKRLLKGNLVECEKTEN
ncbi:hypothetical protein [Clostridium saccharoperbutylacetonicum]